MSKTREKLRYLALIIMTNGYICLYDGNGAAASTVNIFKKLAFAIYSEHSKTWRFENS